MSMEEFKKLIESLEKLVGDVSVLEKAWEEGNLDKLQEFGEKGFPNNQSSASKARKEVIE